MPISSDTPSPVKETPLSSKDEEGFAVQSNSAADGVTSAENSSDSGINHIAFIMDGNGRWAKKKHLPRIMGHRAGVEAVRRVVRSSISRGIKYITLFSFSTENWRRPPDEVSELMGLLKLFIRSDLTKLKQQNVRITIIGSKENLNQEIIHLLEEAEIATKACTGLNLIIAFNYGGRAEIVSAAIKLANDVVSGAVSIDNIDEDKFASFMYTANIPDPDLLIRTSGEERISNFLLWQCAYTEFIFMPILWPDFDDAALNDALEEYKRRHRRFGGI